MTNDFHIFNFNTKSFKFGHKDGGNVLDTAAGCDLDFSMRLEKIAADSKCGFDRYHCICGTCVESQFQGKFHPTTCKLDMTSDNAFLRIKFEFFHSSESCGVSFRERVFGVFDQYFSYFRSLREYLVNIFPTRAVGNEFTGQRSGSRTVHFIDGNQKPFAIKSFFDGLNFFLSHNLSITDFLCYHNEGMAQIL